MLPLGLQDMAFALQGRANCCLEHPSVEEEEMHRDPEAMSLAVGPQYSSLGTQPILCASIPGLVPKQLRFCRNYVEIMPSVAEGVKISIQECQHQFRGRRWNCTTINDSLAIFGPVLDKVQVGRGHKPLHRSLHPCLTYAQAWEQQL
ncbi:Wnt-5b protein precursor isoform 1-like protein [Camelus ferus]|nr:Wnt-5b protein precursor isoform 1-like protein [Camelus ferus]